MRSPRPRHSGSCGAIRGQAAKRRGRAGAGGGTTCPVYGRSRAARHRAGKGTGPQPRPRPAPASAAICDQRLGDRGVGVKDVMNPAGHASLRVTIDRYGRLFEIREHKREEIARKTLLSLLQETGLASAPGKLLYSGSSSVKPCDIYLLGYNPGGDPTKETQTVEEHLRATPADWNEYLDAKWCRRGLELQAGQALLQRRVRWMLKQLGYDPRAVCASNLIFARSRGIGNLHDKRKLADACWSLHAAILVVVRPKAILAIGKDAFDDILSRGPEFPIEHRSSGQSNWLCYASKTMIEGCNVRVAAVPHLSRYKICAHLDVIEWLRERLGLGSTQTAHG